MREEILDEQMISVKPFKLYSQRTIVVATFIMGPIASGILLRRNYLNLNEPKKAKQALLLGFLTLFLLIALLVMLPASILDSFPQVIIPGIYTLIVQFIVEKQLGEQLQIHKDNNGKFYPLWKVILVGLAIILLLSTLAFVIGDFMAIR